MARRLPPSLSTLPLPVCPWRSIYTGGYRSPWQEDSHPLFLPFPCPYAHGELSTLPLSGFPWREDSQSFPIVAGQRQNWGSILGEFSRKPLNWDENRNIVLPLRPYLPLMLSV